MIYFTADQHFFHRNILKYCDRPFKNVHHMNKVILEKYHQTISQNDQVYFLGDLTMERPVHQTKVAKLMENLPGIKHLILGNHDCFKPFFYHKMGFSSVHTILHTTFHHSDLAFGAADFCLVHDPKQAQIPEVIWICGHVHNNWKSQKMDNNAVVINVGVDVWDFEPVSIDQVVKEIGKYIINGRKFAYIND